MKEIKHLTNQIQTNLKKTSQKQNNTLDAYKGTDFELEFTRLWVKLSAMYVQQQFSKTMKGISGSVAQSWRAEFNKNAITPNELIFMRDNLSLLKSPEFIPNSITLVKLCRDSQKDETCRTSLGNAIDPDTLPTHQEIIDKRKESLSIRGECMGLINEILHREELPKEEKSTSWINHIAPGPTDKMVRLIHNHNRLLISQGLSPINMPQCKKRAFELGLS